MHDNDEYPKTPVRQIPDWLTRLEPLRAEYEYMARVISHVLWEAGTKHRLFKGTLTGKRHPRPDAPYKSVPHYWVELTPKRGDEPLIIDLRGRWAFGAEAPYGVFTYREAGTFLYEANDDLTMDQLPLGYLCDAVRCDITQLLDLSEVRATDWWSL